MAVTPRQPPGGSGGRQPSRGSGGRQPPGGSGGRQPPSRGFRPSTHPADPNDPGPRRRAEAAAERAEQRAVNERRRQDIEAARARRDARAKARETARGSSGKKDRALDRNALERAIRARIDRERAVDRRSGGSSARSQQVDDDKARVEKKQGEEFVSRVVAAILALAGIVGASILHEVMGSAVTPPAGIRAGWPWWFRIIRHARLVALDEIDRRLLNGEITNGEAAEQRRAVDREYERAVAGFGGKPR